MISLFDGEAQLLLKQTKILKDIEIALMDLKTGGKTNLKAGFKHIKRITAAVDFKHYLHIITDGKLNAQGVEILLEKEEDNIWRLVQERILPADESAHDGLGK